jgi:hypothetical protein
MCVGIYALVNRKTLIIICSVAAAAAVAASVFVIVSLGVADVKIWQLMYL